MQRKQRGSSCIRRSNSGNVKIRQAGDTERLVKRLFATLVQAQNGVSHTSYAQALREIEAGRKRSHWIWYVWPSLRPLRPGTSKPHFLLPDFSTAQKLLMTEPLSNRLEEISQAALVQLQNGIPLETLMGGATDATKFKESLTVFAMAAAVAQHETALEQLELFCLCLEAAEPKKQKGKTRRSGRVPKEAEHRPVEQVLCAASDVSLEASGTDLDPRAFECALADPSCPAGLLRAAATTGALRKVRATLPQMTGTIDDTH